MVATKGTASRAEAFETLGITLSRELLGGPGPGVTTHANPQLRVLLKMDQVRGEVWHRLFRPYLQHARLGQGLVEAHVGDDDRLAGEHSLDRRCGGSLKSGPTQTRDDISVAQEVLQDGIVDLAVDRDGAGAGGESRSGPPARLRIDGSMAPTMS